MKKYILIIIASLIVFAAYSQEENSVDNETTKKLTKEQRLEQRRTEEETTARLVDSMVEHRQFVLEADYLGNITGLRRVVDYKLNFIIVDSLKITIQIGSFAGSGGLNSLGGFTTDGTITKFEINEVGKKYKSYNITIFTMTHLGAYDIVFNINRTGNADAVIGGTTSGKLVFYGRLVPKSLSRVYKAMSM